MSNGSIQGQTYLSLQGGELQGNVEMNGNKITGLGDAVNDGDAVNFKVLKEKTEFDNQGILKFAKYAGQIPTKGAYNTVYTITFEYLPTFIIFKGTPYSNNILQVRSYPTNNQTTQNSGIPTTINVTLNKNEAKESTGICYLTAETSNNKYLYVQSYQISNITENTYLFVSPDGNTGRYEIYIATDQEHVIPKPVEVYYI